jgi:hypothetical protein
MPKRPSPHPYAKAKAFERLMLLMATLVQYPGVGCPPQRLSQRDECDEHHDALAALRQQLRAVAATVGVVWPDKYPAGSTLRKDLERLRDYGILERRMYRWGYYSYFSLD